LFDFVPKIGVLLKNGSESPLFLNLSRVATERRNPLAVGNLNAYEERLNNLSAHGFEKYQGPFLFNVLGWRKRRRMKMNKRVIVVLTLTALCLVLTLPLSPLVQSSGYPWQLPRGWSAVSIMTYCNTMDREISVSIAIDSSSPGYRTPYTFGFPDGTHSITVPTVDPCGHPFVAWNTGETNPTIRVSSDGVYIAYYGVSPQSLPYDVVIDTFLDGEGIVDVNITKDGNLTGFTAPHTFTGLRGAHKFTVPAVDSNGHRFKYWMGLSESPINSTSITVLSGGEYTACYDAGLCRYVTPFDPEVVAAANGKSWAEMLDYVSSQISYGGNTQWQMPNETLTLGFGQCRDYATLYVSMLRAEGYTAYVVVGTTNRSGTAEGHAWVVFNSGGTFVHVEPQVDAYDQKSVNFTTYESEYYFDENSILPPIASENPPLLPSQINTIIIPAAIFSAIAFVAISSCIFVIRRKNRSEIVSEREVGQVMQS
jgi:hypothetical protein